MAAVVFLVVILVVMGGAYRRQCGGGAYAREGTRGAATGSAAQTALAAAVARWRSAVAIALTFLLATAGLVAPAEAATLAWGPCTDSTLARAGFQCARLEAPVDPANPAGPQFSLALTRHLSTGKPAERIGSLLYNPGGPGPGLAAAPDLWLRLSPDIEQRFDLVSWDPRGFGATTPALAACTVPPFTPPATGPVDWPAAVAAYRPIVAAANADCLAQNAALAGHVSTADVTDDLEAIRVALGEDTISYYGASYGTKIGYDYAMAHPDKIRAMLLDSSLDPTGSIVASSTTSIGPDDAWPTFAAVWPRAARQFASALAKLDRKPLRLSATETFTRWNLLDLMWSTAGESAYNAITVAIGYVHVALTGTPAKRAAAKHELLQEVGAGGPDGIDSTPSLVVCADSPDRPSPAEQTALVEQARDAAPLLGAYIQAQSGLGCEGLPAPAPVPALPKTSPLPVLIIGAVHDAGTPYALTAAMRSHFPNAHVITYATTQHVNWAGRSACVNRAADHYLITAHLPASDITCPPTHP